MVRNKMTHVIMTSGEVIGKVYQHPAMGRTIVFESFFKMDDTLFVYELPEGKLVSEKDVVDFFRELIPMNNLIKG